MSRRAAYFVLWALLLVLALRMTMTETVRQTVSQMSAQLAAKPGEAGGGGPTLPEIGPAVTTFLAGITFVLAGAAAWCAGKAGVLGRGRVARLGLIFVVLGVGLASTLAAADKFLAVVGLCDVGMAILAGWAVGILCHEKLLGDYGRRIVIAAMVAILTAWTAKGLYQRFIDIPDTIQYYNDHKQEALTAAFGTTRTLQPGDPELVLFESRMLSKEVTGFISLSNVVGTGMVGLLAVLAGLAAGRCVDPAMEDVEPRKKGKTEIPLPILLTWMAGALGLLGVVVLFLTASRGASVIGVAAIVAIVAGAFSWRWIVRRRRAIMAMVGAALVLGAVGVVGYGVTHDRLPSKSLMFRWHYWTASAVLVERSPWVGVGLHNFGDYYTSVKRSSSPEDVKDPHSFFVRVAAEMGVPAAVLIGALIVWMVLAATRVTGVSTEEGAKNNSGRSTILAGVIFCAVWWIVHQLLAEASDQYLFMMSALFAIIAAAGWALASGLLGLIQARGIRFVAVAVLLGAIGMLLYDQINMALVTGPVAMLFWMQLGLADSYDSSAGTSDPRSFTLRSAGTSALCGISGVAILCGIWWPTVGGGSAWDSSPWVMRYLEAAQRSNGAAPDFVSAKASLEAAISRSPRSMDLRHQLMLIKMQLREPVAGDIRAMLELDRANGRIRKELAMPDTDLPAAERIAILQQALRFDAQLPADEIMRLSAEDRAAMLRKIETLRGAGGQPSKQEVHIP